MMHTMCSIKYNITYQVCEASSRAKVPDHSHSATAVEAVLAARTRDKMLEESFIINRGVFCVMGQSKIYEELQICNVCLMYCQIKVSWV